MGIQGTPEVRSRFVITQSRNRLLTRLLRISHGTVRVSIRSSTKEVLSQLVNVTAPPACTLLKGLSGTQMQCGAPALRQLVVQGLAHKCVDKPISVGPALNREQHPCLNGPIEHVRQCVPRNTAKRTQRGEIKLLPQYRGLSQHVSCFGGQHRQPGAQHITDTLWQRKPLGGFPVICEPARSQQPEELLGEVRVARSLGMQPLHETGIRRFPGKP